MLLVALFSKKAITVPMTFLNPLILLGFLHLYEFFARKKLLPAERFSDLPRQFGRKYENLNKSVLAGVPIA